MAVNWTADQLKAIESRNKNIIVSASAGSGKTTVIIERITRLLKEGNQLSRMLIITFTRAAASDMKDKLAIRLANDPLLKEQLKQLVYADISTMHSWCQKIIGEYFYLTNLDPDFEILDEYQSDALLEECIELLLQENMESLRPSYLRLLEIMGGREDKQIKENVRKIYKYLIVRPEFKIEVKDESAIIELNFLIKQKQIKLLNECEQLYFDTIAANFKRNILAAKELISCAQTLTRPEIKLSGKIDIEFAELNERYKFLKEKLKELIAEKEVINSARPASYELINELIYLANRLKEIYTQKKCSLGKADFNDLEHYALNILNSDSGLEIKSRYDYIFVDEYQDINPLQDKIIEKVKKETNLFLVGDLKQSIYAFRGCEPKIFADKLENAKSDPFTEVVVLNANHRSKGNILKFANKVFSNIMTKEFGGLDYLKDGKFIEKDNTGNVNIFLYENSQNVLTGIYDLTKDQGDKINKGVQTAVQRILYWLEQTIEEDGKKRGVNLSDIAVLIRSNSESVQLLIKTLDSIGLKSQVCDSLKSISSLHVKALIYYLRLINNRFDDVALINSLKGRFGGFTDQELAEIKANSDKTEYFYQAVDLYSNDDPIRKKLNEFFEKLNYFRSLAKVVPVEELIGKVVSSFEYFQHVFLYGDSEAAALDNFLNEVPNYKAKNLCEFLDKIFITSSHASGEDAVQIMTVHASKGLEFPFVIILDAHKKFNMNDLKRPIILYDMLAGIKCYDENEKEVFPSPEWLINKYNLDKKQKEEEMRLLYVAMTRAKYGLDIIAEGDLEQPCNDDPKDSSCWLKWLLPFVSEYLKPAPAFNPKQKNQSVFPAFDQNLVSLLQKRFNFEPKKCMLPPKTYVTALLDNNYQEDLVLGNSLGANAAEKGTLYHKALEQIDFYLDFMPQWQALDEEIRSAVDMQKLMTAVKIVGDRLKGYKIYKEQNFIADMDASLIGQEQEGSVLVQGVIDVIAIKEDKAIILDFKTGKIDPKYKKQLMLYSKAAEKILNLKIESMLVYSFSLEKLLDINQF